jgi:hypothetical protein
MNEMTKPTGFAVRHTSSGADEFLRRADEVYEQQRKAIQDREAAYLMRRQEMVNNYGRKVSDLAAEGVEALRTLDRQHRAEMNAESEKLEAIGRTRG